MNPSTPALQVTRAVQSGRLGTGWGALASPTEIFFQSAYGERCREAGENVHAGDTCTNLIACLKVVQRHHLSAQLHTPDVEEDKATNLAQDAPASKGALCHRPL